MEIVSFHFWNRPIKQIDKRLDPPLKVNVRITSLLRQDKQHENYYTDTGVE